MLFTLLIALSALSALATAQLYNGLYRITNKYYFRSVVVQLGHTIQTVGGILSDDVRVTWFIAPAPGHVPNTYTVQNAHSLQYLSVDGAPTDGSVIFPSDEPFAWTLNPLTGELRAANANLTAASLSSDYLTLLPPGTDPSQQWAVAGVHPFPATYRIWHPLTDTYLTAPASFPGEVTAKHSDPHNALQYWTVSGTSAASLDGSIANIETGDFLGIVNGTVRTSSLAASGGWHFGVEGGGARLTSGADIVAVNLHSRVFSEKTQEDDGQQVFVFVPADADAAGAH